jgi:protein TonB
MVQQPGGNANTVANVVTYSRRFLFYGFALSIVLHMLFGPFIQWQRPPEAGEKIEKVSVTRKLTKVATPKPTPTPHNTPTPQAQTPPPNQTPPPHTVRLKVNVPKTSAQSQGGRTETQYNVKEGSQEGVPQGEKTGAPVAAATAAPTPAPTKPQCANPNVDALAVDKVTPEMPEIARQMGATGTAQIKVSLDENGKVMDVAVYRSTNNKALDKAALDAARQSRYRAELRNCLPTAGNYLYTVTFENQ